jgi:hypothetical protein
MVVFVGDFVILIMEHQLCYGSIWFANTVDYSVVE